jgi:hypothetical protein
MDDPIIINGYTIYTEIPYLNEENFGKVFKGLD